jgi:hypothetical protein
MRVTGCWSCSRANGAAVLAIALFATSTAGAQTAAAAEATTRAPVRLALTRAPGAETCPDAPVVEADVARRLGSSPFTRDASRLIDVTISRERGEWSARIEDRPGGGAPTGSRVVTSSAESCESLALAVGLAVSLMIRAQEETLAPAKAVPPPACAPCPAKVPCESEKHPDIDHVAAFAGVVGALGLLPRAAFGPVLETRVPIVPRASLLVSLAFLPEQRTKDGDTDFSMGSSFGSIGGCYDLVNGELDFSACGSVLLGAIHVVVRNPEPVEPGQEFWSAGSVGFRSDWSPLEPLHIALGVGAFVPFARNSYVVERDGATDVAFTEPAWGGVGTISIGVEL